MWLQLGNENVNFELIQSIEYKEDTDTLVLKGVNGTYIFLQNITSTPELREAINERLSLMNKRKRQWITIGEQSINVSNIHSIKKQGDTLIFTDSKDVIATFKVGKEEAEAFIANLT